MCPGGATTTGPDATPPLAICQNLEGGGGAVGGGDSRDTCWWPTRHHYLSKPGGGEGGGGGLGGVAYKDRARPPPRGMCAHGMHSILLLAVMHSILLLAWRALVTRYETPLVQRAGGIRGGAFLWHDEICLYHLVFIGRLYRLACRRGKRA